MAANITTLGIGISLSDEASANTDRIAESMSGLMKITEELRHLGVDVMFNELGDASNDLANSMALDYERALGGIAPLADLATRSFDEQSDSVDRLNDFYAMTTEEARSLQIALSALTEDMEEQSRIQEDWKAAGKAWDDSFWGKLGAFARSSDMESLKTGVGGVVSSISAMSDAMESFGDSGYGQVALQFEDSTQKMSAALGRGSQGAQRFRDEISAGVMRTQFATGEYLQLAGGLSEAGVAFSDLSVGAQDDFIALNQVFGVSGQQIGMMTRLLPQMGGDTRALMDDVAGLSAAVGVDARGAFQAMPGAVEHARMVTGQFGKEITGSGDKIVKTVVKSGAVFSKVFGKDMAQAMGEAQSALDGFTEELNTFGNVFIGMDSEFGPMSKALMETGKNIFDIQGIMKQGQEDPIAFAQSIRSISDSLGEGSVRQKRFMEQMRRSGLDANLMTLIRDEKALATAIEERAKAQAAEESTTGKATKAFGELSTSMLDTTLEFQKMFTNVKEGVMATLHTAGVVTILKDAFKGAKDSLAGFNERIVKFVRSDEFKGWVETVKPVLAGVGKGILLLGTAFGAIGSAVAGIGGAVGTIFTLGVGVKGLLGPVVKLGGIVGSSLLAPFKLLGPSVTATGIAFANVGGYIKGFLGKAGGVTRWIGGLFTRIPKLGGLLSGLATGFKSFGGMLLKGLGGAGAGIGSLLGSLGGKIMGFVGPLVSSIAQRVPQLLAKFGPKLLKAIPGVGQIIAVIGGVKTALLDMGAVMGDPNATGAEKFQALLRGAFKGVLSAVDGMLLGIPGMIVKKFFPDMERKFNRGFAGLFDKIASFFSGGGLLKTLGGWWTSATNWLGSKLSGFATWFEQQMPNIREFGRVIGGAIGGLAKFAWDTTKSAFSGIWNAIASVFSSEEGAEKVEAAGSGIGSALKSIGLSALQGMGEAMTGAFDGVLEAFGTSTEELKLKAELAWLSTKNGFSEVWDNMKLGVRQKVMVLGNLMMIGVNEFLIDPLNEAFRGIARFFPDMMAGMVDRIVGILEKLPSFTPGLSGILAEMRETKENITAIGEGSMDMISRVDTMNAEQVAAEKQRMADEVAVAQHAGQAREREIAAELGRLGSLRDARQKNATDWRRFTDEEQNGLDTQLEAFRASEQARGQLNVQQMDAAEGFLRDHLSETLSTLTQNVRRGNIDFVDAQKQWGDAVAQGRAAAITAGLKAEDAAREAHEKATTPADAAARAAGTQQAGAFTTAQWRQFIGELTAAKRESGAESVRLTIRGGDVLTRELVRSATRENLNNGNH